MNLRCCSTCGTVYQPKTSRQRFCRSACRESKLGRRKRGNTTQRQYGSAHQRERKRWEPIVRSGQAVCCRCGLPIAPDAVFHLDHDDHDRTRYRGVAHGVCNVRAGAVKGNRQRAGFTSSAPRIAR